MYRGDGAQVVEPVEVVDDQDPQVLGHRHEHLAHGGRLLGLLGVELDAIELGDAVDDGGDVGTEVGFEVAQVETGVLHGVVQQGGSDGDVVEQIGRASCRERVCQYV